VNTGGERRGEGHVAGDRLAVTGSRSDGGTSPDPAEALGVAGRRPLGSRPSAARAVAARVVVAVTVVVDVDRQLVEIVDVVLIAGSTVCEINSTSLFNLRKFGQIQSI